MFEITVVAPVAELQTRRDLMEKLNLALIWLGQKWCLAEPEEASIVVIIMNTAECSKALWEEYRRSFPAERILVYGSDPLPEGVRWSVPRTRQGLPTVLSLVNVLLRLEEALIGFTAPRETYNPQEYIQGIIDEALADGISRICFRPDDPETRLYILPREKTGYLRGDIEKAIPLCLARRDTLQVTELPNDELPCDVGQMAFAARLSRYVAAPGAELWQDACSLPARRYPLSELIWFATLVNSRGRWRAGCQPEDEVFITHSPEFTREFTRLAYYQDYQDMTWRMSRQVLRLADVIAHTHLSQRQVIDFHNACVSLGLIARGAQAHQEAQQQQAIRNQLHRLLQPFVPSHGHRLKMVIAGTVGSGKTTAITTLSDFSPLMTESRPSDSVFDQKSSTTVAMDYGEARFDDLKLMLYGTPGQRRFEFMGEMLCQNAWALLILINHTQADGPTELEYYFRLYRPVLSRIRVLIGITHYDEARSPGLEDYRAYLAGQGAPYPIAPVDPRSYSDIVRFLGASISLLDTKTLAYSLPAQKTPSADPVSSIGVNDLSKIQVGVLSSGRE